MTVTFQVEVTVFVLFVPSPCAPSSHLQLPGFKSSNFIALIFSFKTFIYLDWRCVELYNLLRELSLDWTFPIFFAVAGSSAWKPSIFNIHITCTNSILSKKKVCLKSLDMFVWMAILTLHRNTNITQCNSRWHALAL